MDRAEILSRKPYKKTVELVKEIEMQDEPPCTKCTTVECPETCSGANCYAWHCWFQKHWRDIREAAKEKGMCVE